MAVGLGNVDARAGRGGDGGLKQIDLARAGFDRGVDDGALFHAGDAAGDADDHAGLEEAEARDAGDEFLEHARRHIVIGDDAVGDRVDGNDVRRRAAKHLFRVAADLQQLAGHLIHSDHRRLAHGNAFSTDVEQRAGRAEIDGDVSFKKEHESFTSKA